RLKANCERCGGSFIAALRPDGQWVEVMVGILRDRVRRPLISPAGSIPRNPELGQQGNGSDFVPQSDAARVPGPGASSSVFPSVTPISRRDAFGSIPVNKTAWDIVAGSIFLFQVVVTHPLGAPAIRTVKWPAPPAPSSDSILLAYRLLLVSSPGL